MEKLAFRVIGGGLKVASGWYAERMRQRKYKKGELVFAAITQPRNPEFNKFMHAGFAQVLIDNIEEFSLMTKHDVLKHIQLDGKIECEKYVILHSNGFAEEHVYPRSLSFESMGEKRFKAVFLNMSRYIIQKYWPTATPDQIAEMSHKVANE